MNEKHLAYVEANRRAWNQVAPIHADVNLEQQIQRMSVPGASVLDAYETATLQVIGIAGKAVAQLACNNGRELISIKNLGAGRCVGFDFAGEFIKQAQILNQAAGQDCEFVETDIYTIGHEYDNAFDLIYITIGVLSWMPDLTAFFAVVARLLRPGGHLLIYEMHPILNMLDVPAETETPLLITLPYFHSEANEDLTSLDYYGKTEYEPLPRYWFTHPLSTVMTAILANGLRIDSFTEYPHDISLIFKPLEQYGKVPLCYMLVAKQT